jgi:DNA-directed RNA polymerase specialized sigma24 family protein
MLFDMFLVLFHPVIYWWAFIVENGRYSVEQRVFSPTMLTIDPTTAAKKSAKKTVSRTKAKPAKKAAKKVAKKVAKTVVKKTSTKKATKKVAKKVAKKTSNKRRRTADEIVSGLEGATPATNSPVQLDLDLDPVDDVSEDVEVVGDVAIDVSDAELEELAAPTPEEVAPVAKQAPNKPAIYLSNSELLKEVVASKAQGRMTDRLARMLMLLVRRYASKGNFCNYTYNEDMQSLALVSLCRTWASFDETKYTNCFAYYTQCAKNSFIQQLKSEKKSQRIRDALITDAGYMPSYAYQAEMSSKKEMSDHYGWDNMSDEVVTGTTKTMGSAMLRDRASDILRIEAADSNEHFDTDEEDILPEDPQDLTETVDADDVTLDVDEELQI